MATNFHEMPYRHEILEKGRKIDFLEMCLPGGQIVHIPRGSILRATRGSQVPYKAKIRFSLILYIYIYIYIQQNVSET